MYLKGMLHGLMLTLVLIFLSGGGLVYGQAEQSPQEENLANNAQTENRHPQPQPYEEIIAKSQAKPKPKNSRPSSSRSQNSSTSNSQSLGGVAATPLGTPLQEGPIGAHLAPAGAPNLSSAHNFPRNLNAQEIEAFSDAVIHSAMMRDHIMGVSVAVVVGETPVLIKGYGYDRLSPARRVDPTSSLFRMGSLTKILTYIVARQEIEQGRIKLDDPLYNFLTPGVYIEDKKLKPITLKAIMAQASGFDDGGLGTVFEFDQARLLSTDAYFRREPPRRVRNPLNHTSYSNLAPALMAQALVKTAKARDVPSLIEARITKPLGLSHTTLREPYSAAISQNLSLPLPMTQNLKEKLSEGYVFNGATYVRQPFEYSTPFNGSLNGSTSALDMARLLSLMLRQGKLQGLQLYNESSAQAFKQAHLATKPDFESFASGLMIKKDTQGLSYIGHRGETLWFSSQFVIIPELDLGIYIATNTQTGLHLTRSFPEQMAGHFKRTPMPAPMIADSKNYRLNQDRFMDHYVTTRRSYGGLEGGISRLFNSFQLSSLGKGEMQILWQGQTSEYVRRSETLWVPKNMTSGGVSGRLGLIDFVQNAQGDVIGFDSSLGHTRFERAGLFFSPQTLYNLAILVIIAHLGLWGLKLKGYTRRDRPSEGQMRAELISLAISFGFSLSLFCFWFWYQGIVAEPLRLFTQSPSGMVRFSSFLALIATLGALYQTVSLYNIYTEDHRFNDGWEMWQKIAHTLLCLLWVFFGAIIALWGGLNPFHW